MYQIFKFTTQFFRVRESTDKIHKNNMYQICRYFINFPAFAHHLHIQILYIAHFVPHENVQ